MKSRIPLSMHKASTAAVVAACLAATIVCPLFVSAQTPLTTIRVYPPDASASALFRPLFVCSPPSDTTRLFIVEQRIGGVSPGNQQGRIRVLNLPAHTLVAGQFLLTSGQNFGNEEGLLGLAFHPDYFADAPNPNRAAFFIYITQGGNNHVYRYIATGQNPSANTADASSAQLVLTLNHPTQSNHNGGWIAFGPDGYLYIATGDGGSGCDPPGNAQNINSLLGKMLRLDVSTDQAPANNSLWGYTNPPSNPFVGVAGADEIFHYGLRNPWRCSFDRSNGNLYIGDVGQNAREEVSLAPASFGGGLNFGWDIREGFSCSNIASSFCSSTCSTIGMTNPIWEFPWTSGSAIVGGYVYRGARIPDLKGHYFTANYAGNDNIWSFRYTGTCSGGGQCTAVPAMDVVNRTAQLVPTAPIGGLDLDSIASFGEDAEGEIYIVDQDDREVFKIVVNCAGSSLTINPHPQSQTVCEGQSVMMTVAATGIRGLTSYTWRRGVTVVGTDSPVLNIPSVTVADAGDYTCTVQDQCNTAVSNIAVLTVNTPQLGDVSGDCLINLTDVPLFVDVLLGLDGDAGRIFRSDIDGVDGPNALDVQGFVDLLVP